MPQAALALRSDILSERQLRFGAALAGVRRLYRPPPPPEWAEEEQGFLHKSMYPKKDRILFSLANALHEHKLIGGDTRVTPHELRSLCYRGTKLPEEDVEALLASAAPAPDADGLVDCNAFVATVAKQLGAGPAGSSG